MSPAVRDASRGSVTGSHPAADPAVLAEAADAKRLPRLLPASGQPMDLADHLQVHGQTPYRGGPTLLIHTIEAAGLTGRGGAAFPTHRKLTAVASQKGTRGCCMPVGASVMPSTMKWVPWWTTCSPRSI